MTQDNSTNGSYPPGSWLSQIDSSLEKASEAYADKFALRAAICAIPWIGGSLDVLFSGPGQKILINRILNFIQLLHEQFRQLEENAVDRRYVESEEWFDTVRRTFKEVAETKDQEKIELFARILRGAAIRGREAIGIAEVYISVLKELTLPELQFAKVIYDMLGNKPKVWQSQFHWIKEQGWDNLEKRCPEALHRNHKIFLTRLERLGLLAPVPKMVDMVDGLEVHEGDYTDGVYDVSNLFQEIMEFVKTPADFRLRNRNSEDGQQGTAADS